MADPVHEGVLGRLDDGIGRIMLDRPRALNALDRPMVDTILELLERWRPMAMRAVTIESSNPGVFCAGGDIRRIRQNTLDGRIEESNSFFAAEYRMNEMLASYPVPVVALIDGVCMGGGLGISVHGPFRVVTERAVLAMPETSIGFFPDVGASYFLSRLPGGVGTYLGLTGARLSAPDAVHLGLATHHITVDDLPSVIPALIADQRPVDAVLRDLASPVAEPSALAMDRAAIDAVFSGTSLSDILERLDVERDPWASRTRDALRRASPRSLRVTLDLLVAGRQRTLHQCLEAELAAARSVTRSPDFLEGVRAALVDKDRTPIWATGAGPDLPDPLRQTVLPVAVR